MNKRLQDNISTLIYDNYKLPIKEVPKDKGFGYYGVIALTEDRSLMQCHICGGLYASVALHIRKHKLDADEYRQKFQLAQGSSLIGEATREKYQKRALERIASTEYQAPAHILKRNADIKAGLIIQSPAMKRLSLESRNKRGICPDQVLAKIKDLAGELGHCPTVAEFKQKYGSRFLSPINFHFDGYNKACRKASLIPRQDILYYTKEQLLEKLVEFKDKFNRLPMTSDFDRGLLPSARTYKNHFGTLNWARVEARLGAILPIHHGQYKIMTPDEYIEYKQCTDGRPKDQWRSKKLVGDNLS